MRSEFGSVCLKTKNEINSPYYRQVRTNDYKAWSTVTGVALRLLGKGARKHSMQPKACGGFQDFCCLISVAITSRSYVFVLGKL